jgi:hypothetical protein
MVVKVCPCCLDMFRAKNEDWDERCWRCADANSPEYGNHTPQDTDARSISRRVPTATTHLETEEHGVDLCQIVLQIK